MHQDSLLAALDRLSRRVASWPALVRDIGAASFALWALFFGEIFVTAVPLRAEMLLAVPGALLAWWVFGRGSALFAMLVAGLVVHVMARERAPFSFAFTAAEMAVLAVLGCALVALCIAVQSWQQRQRHRAALLVDTRTTEALKQVQAANAQLARAEADAVRARAELERAREALASLQRAKSPAPSLVASMCDAFEDARRREGGI